MKIIAGGATAIVAGVAVEVVADDYLSMKSSDGFNGVVGLNSKRSSVSSFLEYN